MFGPQENFVRCFLKDTEMFGLLRIFLNKCSSGARKSLQTKKYLSSKEIFVRYSFSSSEMCVLVRYLGKRYFIVQDISTSSHDTYWSPSRIDSTLQWSCLIWDVNLPDTAWKHIYTGWLYTKNMLFVFRQFSLTIVHWFHFSTVKRLCSPTLRWTVMFTS